MTSEAVPIVFPLHPGGGKFRDNTELRYALRGLEKHFKGEYRVIIIGPKRPSWLHGAEWIEQRQGALKTALVMAAEAFPGGFFWWYDDCALISDQTAEELKVTTCRARFGQAATGWGNKLETIRARLEQEGIAPVDYSRPHGPYWFDKGMIDEAFADWPGMKGKFPFESWILSKRRWPGRVGVEAQYYGDFGKSPGAHHVLINWSDGGFTRGLRAWLDVAFPQASRFETGEIPLALGSSVPAPSVEVHTIRTGSKWWVGHCGKTLDRWCGKRGHALHVWRESDISPDYPAAKFCCVDMLKKFLAGGADHLLYVDGDVHVTEDAPAMPPAGQGGFHIMPDLPGRCSRKFPSWCEEKFGAEAKAVISGWIYRNAGVWLCDRNSAERLLAVIEQPYHAAMQEQHHWNWWLAKAAASGMPVTDLPREWNSFASIPARAWFHHLAGRDKARKLESLRALGLIPAAEADLPAHTPSTEIMNIPKIIHACWFSGDPLPELQSKCLASWRDKCPAYEIRIWDRSNWDGNNWRFAREALEHGQWAFASDVCRLDVLHRFGGIYLDLDVSVKKSFDPLLGNEFFTGTERSKTTGFITPYIMGCNPGNDLIGHFLSHYGNRPFINENGVFDKTPNTNIILGQMDKLGVDRYGADNAALAGRIGHVRYPSSIIGYDSPQSYAVHHFESHWKRQQNATRGSVFQSIYKKCAWGASPSGPGSAPDFTSGYRAYLADYMQRHGITSVLDLGCGDWNSSSLIDWAGIDYTGADIVPELVDHLNSTRAVEGLRFIRLDAVTDELPPADMVIVKDILQHLCNDSIARVLEKLRSYAHVLIVQDVHQGGNADIADGGYRPLNMAAPPFNLEFAAVHGLFPPLARVRAPKVVSEWRPQPVALVLP